MSGVMFERRHDWSALTNVELPDQSSRRKFMKAGGIVIAPNLLVGGDLLAKAEGKQETGC